MRRREFLAGLGGAVVWPLAALAQQRTPVVGHLVLVAESQAPTTAFTQALKEAGFVEGQNVAIEFRSASGGSTDCPHWRPIWSSDGSM
jgi:putative tryptophan/tyrosine transport system substrate-binding protein